MDKKKNIKISDLNKIMQSPSNLTVLAPDGTSLSGQYLSNHLILFVVFLNFYQMNPANN